MTVDLWTIFQLILALAAVALVLYLSYILSKFMAKKISNISSTNNIKIIERVSLTQDKGLAIVEIGEKYFLVGFSTNTVEILQELNQDSLHFSSEKEKPNFMELLNSQIKSRMDMKISAKEKTKTAPVGETDTGKRKEK